MLLALEGFDVLHPNYYAALPGFAAYSHVPLGVNEFSKFPFYNDIVSVPAADRLFLSSENISSGYAFLLNGSDGYLRPRVFAKSKKVIFGFSFGGITSAYGYSGYTPRCLCGSEAYNDYNIRRLDVCFINKPYIFGDIMNPSPTRSAVDSLEGIVFICRIFFISDQCISAQFITGKSLYTDLYCGAYVGTYPPIAHSGIIDCDLNDAFNYFEVAVDSAGAVSSEGSAELRLNGKTVYKQTGIVTSSHLDYGSDEFSELSYFRAVALRPYEFRACGSSSEDWYNYHYLVDDIYIANGDGGVNDDFLGPIKLSHQLDATPSVFEFERVSDGEPVDSHDFSSFALPFLPPTQTVSLESSVLGSREETLFSFDTLFSDEIVGLSALSVSYSSQKNLLSPSIHAVSQYMRIPGAGTFDAPSASLCIPGFKFFTDSVYNFNPSTFSRFSADDVNSILFSHRHDLVSAEKLSYVASVVKNSASSPLVGNGTLSNLSDGSYSTGCNIRYCDILLVIPSLSYIAYVDVFTYTNCIDNSTYYNHCLLNGIDSGLCDVFALIPHSVTDMGSNIFRNRFIAPWPVPVKGVSIRDSQNNVLYREIEIYRIVR